MTPGFFGLSHCKSGATASRDAERQMGDQEFCCSHMKSLLDV